MNWPLALDREERRIAGPFEEEEAPEDWLDELGDWWQTYDDEPQEEDDHL